MILTEECFDKFFVPEKEMPAGMKEDRIYGLPTEKGRYGSIVKKSEMRAFDGFVYSRDGSQKKDRY